MRGRRSSRLPANIVAAFSQRAAAPSPLQVRTHVFWQEPSLHLTCPRTRLGGERLYTLLRPTACQGGEGHAVARGDCRRHADSRQPTALSFHSVSRKQKIDSRQPLADNGPPRPPPSPSFRAKRSGAEKSPTAIPLP